MKKLVTAVLLSALAMPLYANCGNDNGNGNGCSGETGPQGPAGPTGPQGTPGTNGNNGTNGANGATGATGAQGPKGEAYSPRAAMLGGIAIRLFDTKRVSLFAFDDYQFDPLPGHDLIGSGAHNNSYGARLVFKLGSSYEEREIAKLKKLLGVK
jgi:hypothetical protein